MADILRVAPQQRDFFNAIRINLVETSPVLKTRQAKKLERLGVEITWHASLKGMPDGPLLLVANEFFDALPIRQFVRSEGGWRERVVGFDNDGRLAFGLGPMALDSTVATVARPPSRATGDEREGSVLEIRAAGDALIADIATRIVEHGGAALVIDYGHAETAFGDTLQSVSAHHYADPLAAPGEADLTAHVDFAALARSAQAAGAAVHGPITQRDFLLPLGLLERAGQLGANADLTTREALRTAVERLAGKDQMGTLFKVMAITRPGIQLPPFPQRDFI
jgi:SAM-dependent MidA family methyltransferase